MDASVIILFFNFLPTWKNGILKVLNTNSTFAQSAAIILQGFLIQQNTAANGNNGHTFIAGGHNCGCQVIETNPSNGQRTLHYSNYYSSTTAFQTYLSNSNTVLPPSSNEYQTTNSEINWNQISHDLDNIRAQERVNAFANASSWWGFNGGGHEQTNNPPPCDVTMFSLYSDREIFEGTLPPMQIPNTINLGTTNITCANKFLIGGNIISFNNPILSNISNYAFANDELRAVQFQNTDVYKRSISCEAVVENTSYFSYSDYCPPNYETTFIMLANKIGTYKYICFPKLNNLSGISVHSSTYREIYYRGAVPDNLSGHVFTLPDSCIKRAQAGDVILGINGSNNYACQTLDCAKVPNGMASIDNCGACAGGSTGVQPCTRTQSDTRYYTTINNDTTKYYYNDTIYIPQRNVDVKIKIHKVGGTLAPTDLSWKRNDTAKCTNVIECFVSAKILGSTLIRVDSGTTKILIKNPLAIYKVPTLYFKRGNNYDGEYGFDDSTHKYLNIINNDTFKLGYKVRKIMSDSNYFVPWMSLLDKDTAILKDSLANFSTWAKKDKSGYLEFKTNTNKIVFSTSKLKYSNASNINVLNIYAEQWSTNIENLRKAGTYDSLFKTIYAITNTGDTIGSLNLSCSKPVSKKITFIYVNVGNGYDSSILSRVNILNRINSHSHNQIFRKWNLNTQYIDTLNLTAEYIANPQYFSYASEDTLLKRLRLWYRARTGINIDTINFSPNNNSSLSTWSRFAFVVPLEMRYSRDSISTATGQTITLSDFILGGFVVGASKGVFYKNANLATFGHEAGHALNLYHTWEYPFFVPKQTTKNIMDYLPRNGTANLNEFWYGQWLKVY